MSKETKIKKPKPSKPAHLSEKSDKKQPMSEQVSSDLKRDYAEALQWDRDHPMKFGCFN